jgi:hypothetical protein
MTGWHLGWRQRLGRGWWIGWRRSFEQSPVGCVGDCFSGCVLLFMAAIVASLCLTALGIGQ